jgi:hypothetical protein
MDTLPEELGDVLLELLPTDRDHACLCMVSKPWWDRVRRWYRRRGREQFVDGVFMFTQPGEPNLLCFYHIWMPILAPDSFLVLVVDEILRYLFREFGTVKMTQRAFNHFMTAMGPIYPRYQRAMQDHHRNYPQIVENHYIHENVQEWLLLQRRLEQPHAHGDLVRRRLLRSRPPRKARLLVNHSIPFSTLKEIFLNPVVWPGLPTNPKMA